MNENLTPYPADDSLQRAKAETVAKCMFIGLAFGKLELMLFGENEDGDTCD